MKINVDLGKNSYPIYIENHILERAGALAHPLFSGKRVMVISDRRVFSLYGKTLLQSFSPYYTCAHLTLPCGEPTKSFHSLPQIYSALLQAGISRSDLIVALGGGVIGDLAGFAAASFLRGVKLIQIPTSLLAQVDSSVGGKTAVDLPEGKNLVGAFYQPSMVLIDPTVLDSLEEHFVHDGMGEVIKYGCIQDKELFERLARYGSFENMKPELGKVIARCVDIKRRIVEQDQFDTGKRMLLNFGHTLAHAIEQHFQYERESHGEAVAIGMYQMTKIAEEERLTPAGTAARVKEVLAAYGLPHSCGLPVKALMDAIGRDKKNLGNRLNIVLLHEIGTSYVYPTSLEFFSKYGERVV